MDSNKLYKFIILSTSLENRAGWKTHMTLFIGLFLSRLESTGSLYKCVFFSLRQQLNFNMLVSTPLRAYRIVKVSIMNGENWGAHPAVCSCL